MTATILPRPGTRPLARCAKCGFVGEVLVFTGTMLDHIDPVTNGSCTDRTRYEGVVGGWWASVHIGPPQPGGVR